MAWRSSRNSKRSEAEQDEGDVWYWIEDTEEAPMALGLGHRGLDDEEERRPPSRIEADRRTLESFNRRKKWDPRSKARAALGDNTDYEWLRRTRNREDPSMYDSWAQYEEDEVKDNDYQEPEPPLRRGGRRPLNRLEEKPEERWSVKPSVSRDWRNVTSNKVKKDKSKKKEEKKNKKKEHITEEVWTHVVCIDESADAERAFRHASRNLPQHHRLILAHGVYKGILGSHRDDEERLRRVKNKYLRACSDLGRECTFKQFKFSSFGHFGEEVCSLAEDVQAESVLVGRRSLSKSDPAGSASKSVLKACHVPVSVIVQREQEKQQPSLLRSRRTFGL